MCRAVFRSLAEVVTLFKNTSLARAPIWLMIIQHEWNVRKEARINNSAPSKKMVNELPQLRFVKAFQTQVKLVCDNTKKQLTAMETELRRKLLQPFGLSREVICTDIIAFL